MPQMFPMKWTFLTMALIITLLLSTLLIYVSLSPSSPKPLFTTTPPLLVWTW